VNREEYHHHVAKLWNSLPQHVVKASSSNIFKTRLDQFWSNQDCEYLSKTDLSGTGSRSRVLCNCDDIKWKFEADIKA